MGDDNSRHMQTADVQPVAADDRVILETLAPRDELKKPFGQQIYFS